MPIYEYRCGTCSRRSEILVRSSAITPLCPTCGSPLTHKLFSAPNIITGRTQPPVSRACCGSEEHCEDPACGAEGECRCQ